MDKSDFEFKEKKFISSQRYNGILEEKGEEYNWNRGRGSGIAEYLSKVCFENKYFFNGQVLVEIKLDRDVGTYIDDEYIKYLEQVNLKWQPSDKEPSELIKIITEEFGFKETK